MIENLKEKIVKSKRVGVVFGLVIVLGIILIGAIAFLNLREDKINVGAANNPLEALDRLVRQSAIDILENTDAEEFNQDRPLSSIGLDEILLDFESNYAASPYKFTDAKLEVGNTTHKDIKLYYENEGMQFLTEFDIYSEITEKNIDNYPDIKSVEDILDYFGKLQNIDSNLLLEDRSQILVEINISNDDYVFVADIEITIYDGEAFVVVEDLVYDDQILSILEISEDDIKALEDANFKFALDTVGKLVFESSQKYTYSEFSDLEPTANNPGLIIDQLDSYLASQFELWELNDEEMQLVMSMLKEELIVYFNETDIITEIHEVGPRTDSIVGKCYSGKVNTWNMFRNILATFSSLNYKFAEQEILEEDSSNLLDYARSLADDVEELDIARDAGGPYSDFATKIYLKSCNQDEEIVALGLQVAQGYTNPSIFDIYLINDSVNSDYSIKIPEVELLDITEDLEQYFHQGGSSEVIGTKRKRIEKEAEALSTNAPVDEIPSYMNIIAESEVESFVQSPNGFFKDVRSGDIVILYNNYILIYRESEKKIVFEKSVETDEIYSLD